MAKYYGVIGYADTVETKPGVWTEEITERKYFGDVNRNMRRLQSADKLNDDVAITNELSIVADPYAMNHFHSMRYAEFMGAKYKVTDVTVQPPRLILTLGGLYTDG
jgi:hypothetical protein